MLKSTLNYMLFLLILSSLKIFGFYTTVPEVLRFSTLLSTTGWLILFFLLFTFFFREWGFGLYCVISIALFIDFLYFQNFGNLPSVKQLVLLPQVGKLGANIRYFTNFFSLLFVADLIPLGIFDRRRYLQLRTTDFSTPKGLFLTMILCSVFAIVPLVSEKLKPGQVFNRYGFFAYHIFDIATVFSKPERENYSVTHMNHEQPSSKKYWSIASNRNIIVVQLESFQNFLVNMRYNGQEVTPNLNKLVRNDSIYFNNYYQQTGIGNTADAEFVSLVSLHVPGDEVAYEKYTDIDFYALPRILKNHGFHTVAMHGNVGWFWNRFKIYPHLGFEKFLSLEDFNQDEVFGMGLNDVSFFEQSVDVLKNYPEPFFSFLVTVSSHSPFVIPEQYRKLMLLPEDENTMFGNYLQAVHYADYALGIFVDRLKKAGLYERCILILYGDHAGLYPFNKESKERLSVIFEKEYTYKEAMNIPLIFHIPGCKINEIVSTVGGQIDFLRTVLNVIGIDDSGVVSFGRDLLNTEDGFVALRYHVPDGSFVDDERYFEISKDGILQNSLAVNYIEGTSLPYYECLDGFKAAVKQIETSKNMLETAEATLAKLR